VPHTIKEIEDREDGFYMLFLDKITDFANHKKGVDGVEIRQLVAAAGVVAKQRQTRGAMKALTYQIQRDTGRGLIASSQVKE
jgi:hypothetical protein